MSRRTQTSLPPYSYVPGGPWPHPTRSPEGHLHGRTVLPAKAISNDDWKASEPYQHGVMLFNEGYYWEAHEAWESLWHAEGRTGLIANILRALIKLAAAGVKVRENRPAGVRTHATRAADILEQARTAGGRFQIGLDLDDLIGHAREVAANPPVDHSPRDLPVVRVFDFRIQLGDHLRGPD